MAGVRSRLPRARGGRLTNLNPMFQRQTVEVEASQLTPFMVKQSRKSGKLNLSCKNLTTVPDRVWQLDSLDEVELRLLDLRLDSSVSERGEGESKWWEHEPLHTLDLSQNTLASLPPHIKHLAALTTLHLHHNSLTSLPVELGCLNKLSKLNLSHNKLQTVPEAIFKLTELRHLNLSHNKITHVGEAVGDLIMLEKLDMSHNSLTVLPPGVGFLTRLTQLLANNNNISDVPPDIGNLRVLRELDLSNNEASVLPPLGELRKLEVLRADHNTLSQVPDLRGCSQLRELHLGGNCIAEVETDLIEEMSNLRVLNLRDNKLEEIPEELGNLRNLVRVDLANNGIKDVPANLSLLPHLSSLQLEGNPLKSIRSDVVRAGTSNILRVLRGKLREGESNLSTFNPSAGAEQATIWPNKYSMRSSKILSLGMKQLSSVPDEPFTSAVEAEVTCVDLCKNYLTAVPSGVFLLSQFLSELSMANNKLTEVPADLAKCRHLQYLDVSKNCLSDLPQEMSNMERLREVNIGQNRLTAVPACLYGQPGLEIIIARDNKIAEINHEGLASIPRLATLDLANNDIHVVPPQLGLLRLHCLELTGNAFRTPRHAILEKGTASIMSYLRDRLPT